MQHRPGKSFGHADGLFRMSIVNQVTTSQSEDKLDELVKTKLFELIHENGNLFNSKDSLAHCISSDFKLSAGIARSFKRKFPYNFPESTNSPFFVQQSDNRIIYHLVTKKRFFPKTIVRYFCDNHWKQWRITLTKTKSLKSVCQRPVVDFIV